MEKAYLFGEKSNLIGILSEPDELQADKDRPFIIILNSGFVHRPGTFRMNKEFSMMIADQGFSSFRFDLSGIGDSEKLEMDSMRYKDRNLSDIGEAIRFIKEKLSPSKIIVMGLCTGADLAHQSAVMYPEISGTILLDGYGYPTPRFYLKRYGPILYSPKRIFGVLCKIVSRLLPGSNTYESEESGTDAYYWVLPDKKDYMADMEKLCVAGKKHFYAYTAGVGDYYNYEGQFEDLFKSENFKDTVEVHYFQHSDHTYILHSQRKMLFNKILKWIEAF